MSRFQFQNTALVPVLLLLLHQLGSPLGQIHSMCIACLCMDTWVATQLPSSLGGRAEAVLIAPRRHLPVLPVCCSLGIVVRHYCVAHILLLLTLLSLSLRSKSCSTESRCRCSMVAVIWCTKWCSAASTSAASFRLSFSRCYLCFLVLYCVRSFGSVCCIICCYVRVCRFRGTNVPCVLSAC